MVFLIKKVYCDNLSRYYIVLSCARTARACACASLSLKAKEMTPAIMLLISNDSISISAVFACDRVRL